MNPKMERIKRSIDDIKKERDELREKYSYLVGEMKKSLDKNSQDIAFLMNEVKGLTGKESTEEGKVVDLRDEVSKSLDGVRKLNESTKKMQLKEDRLEEKIGGIRSSVSLLEKSLNKLDGKQSVLKENLSQEVATARKSLNSEITSGMKTVESRLVTDIKKEIDKSLQGVQEAGKNILEIGEWRKAFEEKFSNLRSSVDSMNKSLAKAEGRYALLKEKMEEDMKSMGRGISTSVSERLDSMDSSLRAQVREALKKDSEKMISIAQEVKSLSKKNLEYDKEISGMREEMNDMSKAFSEISGSTSAMKQDVSNKVDLLEKEMMAEISKVKGLEETLDKDIENFHKFSENQRSKMDKFESRISDKIDAFAMDKENLKKEFAGVLNDFKNINHRLDTLRDRGSELGQQLQKLQLDAGNSRKMSEEAMSKLSEDNSMFKENVISRLNETSEKIINRLSQGEIRTSSDIAKHSEEIKMFRAHVTNFINELVANYEKRFEMMKSQLDQSLRLMEEKSREQKAMIFE